MCDIHSTSAIQDNEVNLSLIFPGYEVYLCVDVLKGENCDNFHSLSAWNTFKKHALPLTEPVLKGKEHLAGMFQTARRIQSTECTSVLLHIRCFQRQKTKSILFQKRLFSPFSTTAIKLCLRHWMLNKVVEYNPQFFLQDYSVSVVLDMVENDSQSCSSIS